MLTIPSELPTFVWPYFPTLKRLGLALAVGVFVGLERERRSKGIGLRTFGFAALLGALGGLSGDSFALFSLGFLTVLSILLNIHALRTNQDTELTTAAALLVTGYAGILSGTGHTLTPAALAVATAAILAWKQPLAGFSMALTEKELRSAIVLAILAFVIYPALPEGKLDRWGLLEPRAAWLTVLLIAGLGFVNYVLLKLYGARGFTITGFLGGLVNSTVTITELASRDREQGGQLTDITYTGVIVATAAMLLRNLALLGILSRAALMSSLVPFMLMLGGSAATIALRHRRTMAPASAPPLPLESPFSVRSAFRFGLIFVVLEVLGTVAQRHLGRAGFYAVSIVGGLVSSASAVSSAGLLATHGGLSPAIAGEGAVLAAIASALVNLPLIARVSGDRALTRRLLLPLGSIALFGLLGILFSFAAAHRFGWAELQSVLR